MVRGKERTEGEERQWGRMWGRRKKLKSTSREYRVKERRRAGERGGRCVRKKKEVLQRGGF